MEGSHNDQPRVASPYFRFRSELHLLHFRGAIESRNGSENRDWLHQATTVCSTAVLRLVAKTEPFHNLQPTLK